MSLCVACVRGMCVSGMCVWRVYVCVYGMCVCGMSACGIYVWIVCAVGGLCVCVCGVCCGMGALVYMLTVMWKDYCPSVSLRGYWCALTYVSFLVRGDKSVA